MRWMLFAGSAAVAASLWLPGEAAQPTPATPDNDKITFEQYRDWRNDFNERRQSQLTIELAAPDLSADRKARLTQVKAYYGWLTGLPAAERDRRYRERFNRIDANHDGAIDATERTAWRNRERDFYHRTSDRSAAPPRPEIVNTAARDGTTAAAARQ